MLEVESVGILSAESQGIKFPCEKAVMNEAKRDIKCPSEIKLLTKTVQTLMVNRSRRLAML